MQQHKTTHLGIHADQQNHFTRWFFDRQWIVVKKTLMYRIMTLAYMTLATISPITIAGPPTFLLNKYL